MILNHIGKGLVLAHVALSVMAMAISAALFLQFTDLGWVEPRKEFDVRVPSEIDKRAAVLNQAYRARDQVLPPIKPVQDRIADVMDRFPKNHRFYKAELERLREGEGKIDVKRAVFMDKTGLELDATGKPDLKDPVPEVTKSYKVCQKELDDLQKKISEISEEIRKLSEEEKTITISLNGDPGAGTVGLYQVLDTESKLQGRLKAEKDRIQPLWARALEDERTYRERFDSLQRSIDLLNKVNRK